MVVLFSKHKGDIDACIEEFQDEFSDVLLPGQDLPSANSFRRNYAKFSTHHTIADLVSFDLKL